MCLKLGMAASFGSLLKIVQVIDQQASDGSESSSTLAGAASNERFCQFWVNPPTLTAG
jgi:hypothetical protein